MALMAGNGSPFSTVSNTPWGPVGTMSYNSGNTLELPSLPTPSMNPFGNIPGFNNPSSGCNPVPGGGGIPPGSSGWPQPRLIPIPRIPIGGGGGGQGSCFFCNPTPIPPPGIPPPNIPGPGQGPGPQLPPPGLPPSGGTGGGGGNIPITGQPILPIGIPPSGGTGGGGGNQPILGQPILGPGPSGGLGPQPIFIHNIPPPPPPFIPPHSPPPVAIPIPVQQSPGPGFNFQNIPTFGPLSFAPGFPGSFNAGGFTGYGVGGGKTPGDFGIQFGPEGFQVAKAPPGFKSPAGTNVPGGGGFSGIGGFGGAGAPGGPV